MKHLAKRTLSLLLAALMVLSLIPASTHVHAAEITTAYYGTDNTKDANLQLSTSVGSVKTDYLTSYAAWAIKQAEVGFVLSEAFLSDFDGKATVEVEYLNDFASVFDLKYIANDGSVKTATEYTTKTGTKLSNRQATIRVYELTDMANTTGVIGSLTKASSVAVTTTSASYVGIRSVRVTKTSAGPILEPEFNEANFGGVYVYDDMASPALTVKNPHEDVEMTARIYVTLKKDGVNVEGLVQKRLRRHEDGAISTTDPVDVISSAAMTDSTSAEGTYDLVVNSFIKVNGGDEVQIDKTLSFKRATTFTHEVVEVDGNVYYSAKAVSEQAVSYAPNGAKASVIDAEGVTIVGPTSMGITLTTEQFNQNLHELIKDLDYGTYTIKVEAYKGSQLRGTATYEYNYEEPPAFEPEFGTISTVLDNAAVPELTITNTHETLEMTTAIKATLKLNGELHPSVQNVSVGPEEAVAAGQTATLISTELLSKFATAKGNWEIVLTGTVTVDGVAYDVNETISFSRIATFTHSLAVSDGNIIYTAKAESAEAEVFAPNGVKIYVEDAEGKTTIAGPTSQAVSVTVAGIQSSLNGLSIIKDLEPGTYTIKVEAYKNSELRNTATVQYTVAPKCEHSGVTNGDCTATTQVTCPDCQETVTVQAAHTYEDDNDCTTGHNCSVCGNEAVAAEDDHSYTDKQDASCNNKGCNYVRYIHYGSNVTLGNSIDVNVTVSIPAGEKDQHKAYVQVAGGEKVEVELTENGTNFCDVTLPGLAAKDLYKEINVTVCDENGEEVHNVTESFAAYAERLFASEANDNDKKMIADMVAYAVAAQNYFLKNTDNSVIAQLEEAGVDYTQYTDDVNPTCTDERAFTGNRSLVQGTNFDLKDEISMNMYVRDVDYAVIEYIPYNKTELVSVTIQASECVKSGSYYKFKIPGYVTADGASTVVTAKFYVNGNDEPVVTVTDSMASYVARQGASLTWLYTMQKYANSAYAALTD